MRFLLVSCSLVAAYAQGIVTDGATRADWPHYGGTQLSWRYSALDQINTGNVKKLAPAWVFQTGDYTDALQSTPIVVSGVLYLSSPRSQVYALDAATGQLLWQFKYPLPPASAAAGILTRPQNRGVAVGDGYVFLGTYDNYVVAIDAKTGHEAWKVNIDDSKHCGCIISGAPLVVKDKVIVGGTGGDGAHRGYLTALEYQDRTACLALLHHPRARREGQRNLEGR
jgi:glucose dehydrogenase